MHREERTVGPFDEHDVRAARDGDNDQRERNRTGGTHIHGQRQQIDRREHIDQPEHARDLQLHGEGETRDDERQRQQEDHDQSGRAPDQCFVFSRGLARMLPSSVCPPQQREQCEVGDPRPQRPLRGEQRVFARYRLQPHVIHPCH